MEKAIAHIKSDNGETAFHLLEDHLIGTSRLVDQFCLNNDWRPWIKTGALLHDLGKYSNAFQEYIRQSHEWEEGEIENRPGRVEHAIIGALHLWQKNPENTLSKLLPYLVAGHHTGLTDWNYTESGQKKLDFKLEQATQKGLLDWIKDKNIPKEVIEAPVPQKLPQNIKTENCHIWLRMLFSCLVDADYLDTESFMQPTNSIHRSNYPTLNDLKKLFDSFMDTKFSNAPETTVNRIRTDVLLDCRAAAKLQPGLFSLTVPTGGGKTLSGTAFALDHALNFGKKRLIYVIPYTSIIEQTAAIFRSIFGEENVIEHHSNTDIDAETPKSRLAAENWDAPIIVTTNVQFFESLFASRTSRCRKLHNIMDSVVILDEAQMLPPDLLDPILNIIRGLSTLCGVSFVLSTATQPALNKSDILPSGLEGVREIIRDTTTIYKNLNRVQIILPIKEQMPESCESLAEKLCKHEQVLCIVSTRRFAWDLHKTMPSGTLHLSALMCGHHRSEVIAEIKNRLTAKKPVRVISTQVIEAGVDIDFPVVYRALAGLDSIAQAAGRCNREGRMDTGIVHVFLPPKQAPLGLLRKGEDKTREMLACGIQDFLSPDTFHKYFQLFYSGLNSLDKHNIKDLLWKRSDVGLGIFQFITAATLFQMIEDGASYTVYVQYGDSQKLINSLRFGGPSREVMRKLQRFAVQVPPRLASGLLVLGFLEQLEHGFLITRIPEIYTQETGLQIFGKEYGTEELII